MTTSGLDDALMDKKIFPDYPQYFTTIIALDNDDIFQAHAEYRRQTRASTSPELRDIFIKVRHIYPSCSLTNSPSNPTGSPWYQPVCGSLKMRDSTRAAL